MRHLLSVSGACDFPALATAADGLDWAYPVTPRPEAHDNLVLKRVPGSAKSYTQAQIDDPFNPPDWFPDEHPPMPAIVAQGSKPAVRACAQCHLPSGDGHPESSSLAGLPVRYLVQQMSEFKNGGRKGVRATTMIGIAQAISDADTRAASEYFASLKPGVFTKVIETETVPKSYVGAGGMRFAEPGGEKEPIGNRIIVLPQDEVRAKSRDPHSGFIDYVPMGSIARGEALVRTGGAGKTTPCAMCHGQNFKGLGDWPVDRGPSADVYRAPAQRHAERCAFRRHDGADEGGGRKADPEDMIAIAAYLGSRDP